MILPDDTTPMPDCASDVLRAAALLDAPTLDLPIDPWPELPPPAALPIDWLRDGGRKS